MFRYSVVFGLTFLSLGSICLGASTARSGKAAYHPCPHHSQDNIYSQIKAQSEARIVNKANYNNVNPALETAASNSLAHTVTLNSQIAVSGGSGSGNDGAFNGPPIAVATGIDHQHLPAAGRPPVFNNNAYLPKQPQLPVLLPPPPPQPAPLAHLNRPNHHQTLHGQQNGFSSAQTNFQKYNNQQSSFNYRPPLQHLQPQLSNLINNYGNSAYAASFSHQTHGQQHFGGHHDLRPIPSVAGNSLDGQLGHIIQDTFAQASLDPSAAKHIYVHVPPEDLEEKSVQQNQFSQPPAQKHYKIIFIKAPTYNQPSAAQLAATTNAQQSEEKTLIYVLVKKPEEPSVEELQQIQETAIKHHKPEVYFIKYKTRKEGEDLQNQLLQQDTLPGANELSDAGIDIRSGGAETAPVSTSSSYATSAISTPSSHQPNEFYGVPIQ